jgi:hypothetical protein
MRFDKFDRSYDDIVNDDKPAIERRLPVPDGERDFEIKKVNPWKEKLIVTFAVASGDFAWVVKFFDPADQRDHDIAVCILHALGLPDDTEFTSDLVGRFVRLLTKQAKKNGEPVLDKKGEPIIYVNGATPSKLEVPTSKPAPRPQTAAGRVATAKGEEAGGWDDIPFMWMLPLALAVASLGGLA